MCFEWSFMQQTLCIHINGGSYLYGSNHWHKIQLVSILPILLLLVTPERKKFFNVLPPCGSHEWCFDVQPAYWWPICVNPCLLFWTAVGTAVGMSLWWKGGPKSGRILMVFPSMKIHPLLLNHSMTSLHMAPMSDVLMCNQLIGGPSVSTHAFCFGLQLEWVWQGGPCSEPKLMVFPAVRPHHLLLNHSMSSLHMAPMSDVLMCNQLLVAHLFQPILFCDSCPFHAVQWWFL